MYGLIKIFYTGIRTKIDKQYVKNNLNTFDMPAEMFEIVVVNDNINFAPSINYFAPLVR